MLSINDLLLRLSLRHDVETGRIEEFMRSGLDWQRVLDRSMEEGVFYPFYRTLTALNAANVIPAEFRGKFRQTYLSHIAQSENFFDQATLLLERLDALNIKILFFKGPAIDTLIYDGFYRPRVDLDIAARHDDLPVIEKAFASGGQLKIHIHRHLINNTWLFADNALAAIDMERVRQETVLFREYKNLVTLGPEMNILFLCEHAVKHGIGQLVLLYEIDRLIRFYGKRLDWRKFAVLAEEFGLGHIVYYGLYFTREVLSGDIPDDMMRRLKPERLTAGEKSFIEDTLDRKAGRYSSYCVYLAARKGLAKKARFLFKTAFPQHLTLAGNVSRLRRLILP